MTAGMQSGFWVREGLAGVQGGAMTHGAGLGLPSYTEVARMETRPTQHSQHARHPLFGAGDGEARPRMQMPPTLLTPSVAGTGLMDSWDPQAMAAHRHRILISQDHAAQMPQRPEWEGARSMLSPQRCPPGFMPNMYPKDSSAALQRPQPDVHFSRKEMLDGTANQGRNFRVDKLLERNDPVHRGIAEGRNSRGWFDDEGFTSGRGREYINHTVYGAHNPPSLRSKPPVEHMRTPISVSDSYWDKSWCESRLRYHGPPAAMPVSKNRLLSSSVCSEFLPSKRAREDPPAGAQDRKNLQTSVNFASSMHPPPSKRLKEGHGLNMSSESSRRDRGMGIGRLEGLWSRAGESREAQYEPSSSSPRKKHAVNGTMARSEEGRGQHHLPQQLTGTTGFAPRFSSERGLSSSKVRDRVVFPAESSQELLSRPKGRWCRPSGRESSDYPSLPEREPPSKFGYAETRLGFTLENRENHSGYNSSIDNKNRHSRSGTTSYFESKNFEPLNEPQEHSRAARQVREIDHSPHKHKHKDSRPSRLSSGNTSLAEGPLNAGRRLNGRVKSDIQHRASCTPTLQAPRADVGFRKDGTFISNTQHNFIGDGNKNSKIRSGEAQKRMSCASKSKGSPCDKVDSRAAEASSLESATEKLLENVEQLRGLGLQVPFYKNCLPGLKQESNLNALREIPKTEQKQRISKRSVPLQSAATLVQESLPSSLFHPKSTNVLKRLISQSNKEESQIKVSPAEITSSPPICPLLDLPVTKSSFDKECSSLEEQSLIIPRTPSNKPGVTQVTIEKQQVPAGNNILGSETRAETTLQMVQKVPIDQPAENVKIRLKGEGQTGRNLNKLSVLVRGPSHCLNTVQEPVDDMGNGRDGRLERKVIFTGHKTDHTLKDSDLCRTKTGSLPADLLDKLPVLTSLREQALANLSSRRESTLLTCVVGPEGKKSELQLSPLRCVEGEGGSPLLESSVQASKLTPQDKEKEKLGQWQKEKLKFPLCADSITGKGKLRQFKKNFPDISGFMKTYSISEGLPRSLQDQLPKNLTSPMKDGLLVAPVKLAGFPRLDNAAVGGNANLPTGNILPEEPMVREVRLFGTNLNASNCHALEEEKQLQADQSLDEGCQRNLQSRMYVQLPVDNSQVVRKLGQVMNILQEEMELGSNSMAEVMMPKEVLKEGEELGLIQEAGVVQANPEDHKKYVSEAAKSDLNQDERDKSSYMEREHIPERTRTGPEESSSASIRAGPLEQEDIMGDMKKELQLEKLQDSHLENEGLHSALVLKNVGATPPPGYVLETNHSLQLQQPQSKIAGSLASRPYGGNIWRRDAVLSGIPTGSATANQLGQGSKFRSAIVPHPAAYVRKRNSLVRFPAVHIACSLSGLAHVKSSPQAATYESASKDPCLTVTGLQRESAAWSASKDLALSPLKFVGKSNTAAVSNLGKTSVTSSSFRLAAPQSTNSRYLEQGAGASRQPFSSSLLSPTNSGPHELAPSKPATSDPAPSISSLNGTSPVTANGESAGYVVSGTKSYMQKKVNKLIVAPFPQTSMDLASFTRSNSITVGFGSVDSYVKRRRNQLIRNGVGKEIVIEGGLQEDSVQGAAYNVEGVNRHQKLLPHLRTKLRRVLRQKGPSLGSAWVWTLSSGIRLPVIGKSISRGRASPLLLPWKRVGIVTPRLRRPRFFPETKKGSFLFHLSNKLRRFRSAQPTYTRSADGFSLHRSGVVSQGGANLKWTKSLEKQHKLASEAATKVVAEAEKQKRERKEAVVVAAKAKAAKRSAQKAARGLKMPFRNYGVSASAKAFHTSAFLLPRSQIGGSVYVRVGSGNQLVRNAKAATRAFANEKVRWSLYNARFRNAKKQIYCQFYTRFGKCNKGDGKCQYLHDADKVAVCTKFLKGSCSDPECLLTHKVIPERMSDCSYFLEGKHFKVSPWLLKEVDHFISLDKQNQWQVQVASIPGLHRSRPIKTKRVQVTGIELSGLCTNERCPYRHVNVNPRASVCEGFLRGYCEDGDMCNKKHTYVCPAYAETGKCLNSNTCKLHHPKKSKEPILSVQDQLIGTKRKHRYFSTKESTEEDPTIAQREAVSKDSREVSDEAAGFISIREVEHTNECQDPEKQQHRKMLHLTRIPTDEGDRSKLENLLKPRLLLERHVMEV